MLSHLSITGSILRSRFLDPIRKDSDWTELGQTEKYCKKKSDVEKKEDKGFHDRWP